MRILLDNFYLLFLSEKFDYPLNPAPITNMLSDAIVSVITNGDKILLIERAAGLYIGYWAPVSGKVEPGESQEAAVVRESMEEVGLTVRPLRKVWENISSGGNYRLHWWLAEYVSGKLALDRREASKARWVTGKEISGMKIFEGDREFYERVLPSLIGSKVL